MSFSDDEKNLRSKLFSCAKHSRSNKKYNFGWSDLLAWQDKTEEEQKLVLRTFGVKKSEDYATAISSIEDETVTIQEKKDLADRVVAGISAPVEL